jgi:hypothetical protein
MGGMVAQELALLLLETGRLVSLGLAVTCRGLKPLGGLLAPIVKPQVRARLNSQEAVSRGSLLYMMYCEVMCSSISDVQGAQAAGAPILKPQVRVRLGMSSSFRSGSLLC